MEFRVLKSIDHIDDREVGSDATFILSSAKPGNGVDQIRDNLLSTYWQSDGNNPHFITVHFLRKQPLTKLALFLNYPEDESYTPKRIIIYAGSNAHDLREIGALKELDEPFGWVVVDLAQSIAVSEEQEATARCLNTHCLQIKVQMMHQNGKDTHIRQLKIFGKRQSMRVMADLHYEDFQTVEMSQFALIR